MARQPARRAGVKITSLEVALAVAIVGALIVGWLLRQRFEADLRAAQTGRSPAAREIPTRSRVERRAHYSDRAPTAAAAEREAPQTTPLALPTPSALAAPAEGVSSAGFALPAGSVAISAEGIGSSSPSAVTSAAAERARTRAALVRVLWKKRGLCADEGTSEERERTRYIAEFVKLPAAWEKGLYVYPDASLEVIDQVRSVVPALPERVRAFIGLETTPPPVYVHKSVEALRGYSCVNSSAVAYYDGNLHVSLIGGRRAREELTKSLEHEYVHHALLTHGIERPIWFQEGAAMAFARESWAEYRFVAEAIPLETMVEAFAHTAKPEAAQAFYLEAYAMVRLLASYWQDANRTSEADLVELLRSGRATPESLFELALRERAGELDLPAFAFLERYIKSGFR